MEKRVLQQSNSWDDYINNKLKIDKHKFYKEGFPRYVFNADYSFIKYKLILRTGTIIEKAYLNPLTA